MFDPMSKINGASIVGGVVTFTYDIPPEELQRRREERSSRRGHSGITVPQVMTFTYDKELRRTGR
jgi:hypothetical protein